jgi:hypothetical protein
MTAVYAQTGIFSTLNALASASSGAFEPES